MARIAKKTKKLTIYLTDRQYDEIFVRADALGVGMSVIVTLALNDYLEANPWQIPYGEVKQIEIDQLKK